MTRSSNSTVRQEHATAQYSIIYKYKTGAYTQRTYTVLLHTLTLSSSPARAPLVKCSTLATSTLSSSSATASSAPLLENKALLAASAGRCAAAAAGERLPLRLLLAPRATCARLNEGLTGGRGYPGLAGLLAGGAPTVAMLPVVAVVVAVESYAAACAAVHAFSEHSIKPES
eukprot:16787-Heterococcus_DN1.PRE.2